MESYGSNGVSQPGPSTQLQNGTTNEQIRNLVSSLLNWTLQMYHDNVFLKMNYKKFYDITSQAMKSCSEDAPSVVPMLEQVAELQRLLRDKIRSQLRMDFLKMTKLFNIVHFISPFSDEKCAIIENDQTQTNLLQSILYFKICEITTSKSWDQFIQQKTNEMFTSSSGIFELFGNHSASVQQSSIPLNQSLFDVSQNIKVNRNTATVQQPIQQFKEISTQTISQVTSKGIQSKLDFDNLIFEKFENISVVPNIQKTTAAQTESVNLIFEKFENISVVPNIQKTTAAQTESVNLKIVKFKNLSICPKKGKNMGIQSNIISETLSLQNFPCISVVGKRQMKNANSQTQKMSFEIEQIPNISIIDKKQMKQANIQTQPISDFLEIENFFNISINNQKQVKQVDIQTQPISNFLTTEQIPNISLINEKQTKPVNSQTQFETQPNSNPLSIEHIFNFTINGEKQRKFKKTYDAFTQTKTINVISKQIQTIDSATDLKNWHSYSDRLSKCSKTLTSIAIQTESFNVKMCSKIAQTEIDSSYQVNNRNRFKPLVFEKMRNISIYQEKSIEKLSEASTQTENLSNTCATKKTTLISNFTPIQTVFEKLPNISINDEMSNSLENYFPDKSDLSFNNDINQQSPHSSSFQSCNSSPENDRNVLNQEKSLKKERYSKRKNREKHFEKVDESQSYPKKKMKSIEVIADKLCQTLQNKVEDSPSISGVSLNAKCPFCDVSTVFSKVQDFMVHYQSVHQESKNKWKCLKCTLSFKSRDSFVAHARNSNCFHNEDALRKFKCSFCESKFKRLYHLKQHLIKVHQDSLEEKQKSDMTESEVESSTKINHQNNVQKRASLSNLKTPKKSNSIRKTQTISKLDTDDEDDMEMISTGSIAKPSTSKNYSTKKKQTISKLDTDDEDDMEEISTDSTAKPSTSKNYSTKKKQTISKLDTDDEDDMEVISTGSTAKPSTSKNYSTKKKRYVITSDQSESSEDDNINDSDSSSSDSDFMIPSKRKTSSLFSDDEK